LHDKRRPTVVRWLIRFEITALIILPQLHKMLFSIAFFPVLVIIKVFLDF
jgi:hypothetical protein